MLPSGLSGRGSPGHEQETKEVLEQNEDLKFIPIDEQVQYYGTPLSTAEDGEVAQPTEEAFCVNGACQAFGGYRQFQGLADMPLTELLAELSHRSTPPLSETDIMKLRSIMRFATEYHNPLVVRAQRSPPSSPLYRFTEAATECFRAMREIIVAMLERDGGGASRVTLRYAEFRRAASELESLELPAKGNVVGSLRQAAGAVSGQMRDFVGLVESSILPNLPR